MIDLSPRVLKLVEALFREEEIAIAKDLLLIECSDNLPFCEDRTPDGMDQIRISALKCSGGSVSDLQKAIDLAKTDWRDLIMAAGFGYKPNDYLKWRP